MIANIREPAFGLRAHAEPLSVDPANLLILDGDQVLEAGSRAREEGFGAGTMVEEPEDLPDPLVIAPFTLDRLIDRQRRLLSRMSRGLMVLEILDFGEVQVEVEDPSRVEAFLEEEDRPLRASIAPSGWLARILNHRENEPGGQIISHRVAYDRLDGVVPSEFWGLGERIMERFKDQGFQNLGEVRSLSEQDRRERFGDDSPVIERLIAGSDPRPLNAFSRPRKLEQEIPWPPGDNVRETLESPVRALQGQLVNSCSLAHRVTLSLSTDEGTVHSGSRDAGDPFDEYDPLMNQLVPLIRDAPDLPSASGTVSLSGVVANLDDFHRNNLEDETSLEVL